MGMGGMRKAVSLLVVLLCAATQTNITSADEARPKLGPDAVPIQRATEYLRRHDAPDYWALSAYYVPQLTNASCSVASVAMLVNALRGLPARAEEALVTQESLLEAVGSEHWSTQSAHDGDGVTFADLEGYVEKGLAAFGVEAVEVEMLKPADGSPATLERVRRLLTENERSDRDVALVYFNQGVLTGDWDGPHISPIGAYDAGRRRVLVMDVDREWYVPYWSTDQKLLEAMLRPAPADQGVLAGQTGGLVRVRLKQPAH